MAERRPDALFVDSQPVHRVALARLLRTIARAVAAETGAPPQALVTVPPELVTPGVNGWLVPAGSVATLADALRQVLETPTPELVRMGAAGAKRVAALHDAASEAAKLAALFKEPPPR